MPAMFGCWLGRCNHGVHNNYRHDKVRCNEIRHNWAPAVIIANCAATTAPWCAPWPGHVALIGSQGDEGDHH